MPRLMLSDELWSKLENVLLQQAIYHKPDLRMTVEGMLCRMRAGCPWRDLPSAFGRWSSVYKRFNAWSAAGKWLKVSQALIEEPDLEWAFIDGTYVKAHQHSSGAASDQPRLSAKAARDTRARSTWPSMRMACRWLSRSPGATSTTALRPPS